LQFLANIIPKVRFTKNEKFAFEIYLSLSIGKCNHNVIFMPFTRKDGI